METPFVFGRVAEGKNFTNRQAEIKRLANNFRGQVNTTLISPRRWGKSSLVEHAAQIVSRKEKKIRFVFIDLFNVRTEFDFYRLLTENLFHATATMLEEAVSFSRHFFSHLLPQISFSPDPLSGYSIKLDWQEVQKKPDEVLDLAEAIAARKNMKLVVCIDEFQNITDFLEPLAFQKQLRAHWQRHQNVTYCLYGSKRHMMQEVFTNPQMPFYHFGDLILLEKIDLKNWRRFIVQRFTETGKDISIELAGKIAITVENHPFYVQQLAQLCWFRSQPTCTAEIIEEATTTLLNQLSLLFQTLCDGLPGSQLNFLHALIDNIEQLSAQSTLNRYSLGTSANVQRYKAALGNKEIIDVQAGRIEFLDPLFKLWLKRVYFD